MESLIDQLVRTSFPHPIAAAWHKVALATSSADRIKRLLACLEVLVRVQCAVLLPDYLRGPVDEAVDKTLERLDRPALGHWVQLLRSLVRALDARELEPFIPEAQTWYLTKGRPSDASKRLDDLVSLRNEEAHGRVLSLGEQDDRAAEVLTALRTVLGDAAFLASYRPFRILSASLSRKGGFSGRVQFLVGTGAQAEPVRGNWPARLFEESVYLSNPAGTELLELSPFIQVLHDPGPKEDRVFLVAGTHKQKKLVLKSDASGTTENRLVSSYEGDVPFDTWMAGRQQLNLWQVNQGASVHFAVAKPADSEVLAGRFEVRENLGEGGMATVFLVWDKWDEATFALKVLHRQLAEDAHFKERFRREARTMKRLRHPHILSVEETGQLEDGRLYLKLPLLTGGTLQDRVKAGASPPEIVEGWAKQMLSALSYLHEQKVVHRDIKPSNFLLDGEGNACLADFGIALQGDDLRLTRTLEQMGSVAYMSPEQRRGGTVGPATDVYSMGIVLHELCTGKEGDLTPGKGVAEPLSSLIRALCNEDPIDRPTAAAALEQFSPASTGEGDDKSGASGEATAATLQPPALATGKYHLHLGDGTHEVMRLEQVADYLARDPTSAIAIWQPGWAEWKRPLDVAEVAEAVAARGGPGSFVEPEPELGPVVIETIEVVPGEVAMGQERQATLTRGFQVSRPITRGLWADVSGEPPRSGDGDDAVDHVSWLDAIQFCISLADRNGKSCPYAFTEMRPRKAYNIDDVGRMLRDIMPFKKVPAILSHFGKEALDVLQFDPERLAEVPGIGGKTAAGYAEKWDRDKYFSRDVVWDKSVAGYRLPTEAEWLLAVTVPALQQEPGHLDWVWCADPGPVYQKVPTPLEAGAFTDPSTDEGPRRLASGPGVRRALAPEQTEKGLGLRVVLG